MTNDTDASTQPTLWGDVPEPPAASSRSGGLATTRSPAAEASELWTIEQLADYLGVPKQTVYSCRTSGYGPSGFRVGKHLRYVQEDVVAWVEGRKQLAS